jgi:hypothetical protein
MVVITFPDKKTQTRARGFLLRRFSGKVFKSGEHIFPEAAMNALADAGIPFTVLRKASADKEKLPPIRSALAGAVQRRTRSSRKQEY